MDYFEELKKTFAKIEKRGVAIVATSYLDEVSARPVSVVIYDQKIAFQTSSKLLKYQQIKKNPLVAITVDNISIRCIATIKKHPLKEEKFIALFMVKHKSSFDNYSNMQSNFVIELEPLEIQRWDYIDSEPYIITINLKNKTLQKRLYDHGLQD